MNKRNLFLSSLLVLSIGLAACGNDADSTTKKETTKTASTSTEKEEHHNEVDFTFEQNTATAGEKTPLSATLTLKEEPLTDATVRYQITKEGEEKSTYIDLKEDKSGHYTTNYTFKDAGKYTLKLHVMKGDDLHNHSDNIMTVK